MKKLTRESLRHMIREEIAELLTDDALFSKEELSDAGTGSILQLSDFYEEDSEEDSAEGCDVCGGSHASQSPCDQDVEVDFQGSDGRAVVPDISDLTPDEAFALGMQMGSSGEFND